jgi:hypothetical protein
MVTDAAHRRRGYGMDVVRSPLAWRQEAYQAGYADLQVMADNIPASRLCGKFGFEACYRYWYRVKA